MLNNDNVLKKNVPHWLFFSAPLRSKEDAGSTNHFLGKKKLSSGPRGGAVLLPQNTDMSPKDIFPQKLHYLKSSQARPI
jgi:hypothetical protein